MVTVPPDAALSLHLSQHLAKILRRDADQLGNLPLPEGNFDPGLALVIRRAEQGHQPLQKVLQTFPGGDRGEVRDLDKLRVDLLAVHPVKSPGERTIDPEVLSELG